MPSSQLIPATQYLRMSTDRQQYSLDNQAAAIQSYAGLHDFQIVRTYVDAARSGVQLKNRAGIKKLLKDVVDDNPGYRAILVYDVSRWGRFQDTDEAAHYEFICKQAGIPIHYCAEQFGNEGSVSNSILKSLKRSMAAEYSRELGEKCYAGVKRICELGFRGGGQAGFGYRRIMVSSDGIRKQLMQLGQQKNLKTDKTLLVLGPKKEVECIRTIFKMALHQSIASIVRYLNEEAKIPFWHGGPWSFFTVQRTLENPKYYGLHAWGRTTQRMYTSRRLVSPDHWITKPGAIPAIIDEQTFRRVQLAHRRRQQPMSSAKLLKSCKRLFEKHGKLSESILIKYGPCSPGTLLRRFGGMIQLYKLLGYKPTPGALKVALRTGQTKRVTEALVRRIETEFLGKISKTYLSKGRRLALRLDTGVVVSILLGNYYRNPSTRAVRWSIIPFKSEASHITLLGLKDKSNEALQSIYVMPEVNLTKYQIKGAYQIKSESDPWLRNGIRLNSLGQLYETVGDISKTKTIPLRFQSHSCDPQLRKVRLRMA